MVPTAYLILAIFAGLLWGYIGGWIGYRIGRHEFHDVLSAKDATIAGLKGRVEGQADAIRDHCGTIRGKTAEIDALRSQVAESDSCLVDSQGYADTVARHRNDLEAEVGRLKSELLARDARIAEMECHRGEFLMPDDVISYAEMPGMARDPRPGQE